MTVCKVYGIAGFEMTEEKDMAKVTFDYSKASKFISDDEVVAMKKIAEDAKKVLVEKTGVAEAQCIEILTQKVQEIKSSSIEIKKESVLY